MGRKPGLSASHADGEGWDDFTNSPKEYASGIVENATARVKARDSTYVACDVGLALLGTSDQTSSRAASAVQPPGARSQTALERHLGAAAAGTAYSAKGSCLGETGSSGKDCGTPTLV